MSEIIMHLRNLIKMYVLTHLYCDFERFCPQNVNIDIRIFLFLVSLTLHSISLAVNGCLITIPKSVVYVSY